METGNLHAKEDNNKLSGAFFYKMQMKIPISSIIMEK